ncbi:AAA family ATPase [Nocardia otitidiscaviarum]|uniref:ATP-binding protein n=2 Tax=Nocardia otitidiscaviarum TaxID=1823 RepID=UPI0018933E8D|nr:AAA family ATPase [Nocardia otitidiscaviarum]MBF6482577.1 AAA family ATPase [Nocardia otitidiscaviarum]
MGSEGGAGPVTLIGREESAAVLREHLRRTLTSHGGLVLVAGEAGIGKTALMTRVLGEFTDAALVLAATAWSGDGVPGYWPWVQILRRLRDRCDADEWAAVVDSAGAALIALTEGTPGADARGQPGARSRPVAAVRPEAGGASDAPRASRGAADSGDAGAWQGAGVSGVAGASGVVGASDEVGPAQGDGVSGVAGSGVTEASDTAVTAEVAGLVGTRSGQAVQGNWALFEIGDAVTAALVGAARRRPVFVVIDDLHHADPESVRVLTFLARHAWFERIAVVAAVRDTELAAEKHPLREVFPEVWAAAQTVELSGLSGAETAALAARLTGSTPPPEIARRIASASGGNPFLAEQATRLWHGGGSIDTLTPGVRQTLDARLAPLPERVVAALGVAAVVGREFSVPVVAAALDTTPAELADTLAQAARARLIGRTGTALGGTSGDRFVFVHDLIRETLLARLDAADLHRRHADVLAALERLPRDVTGATASDFAHHAYQLTRSGDPAASARALHYLLSAAADADTRSAAGEAAHHYRRALTLLPPDNLPRRGHLGLALAAAAHRAGELPEARAAYETVLIESRAAHRESADQPDRKGFRYGRELDTDREFGGGRGGGEGTDVEMDAAGRRDAAELEYGARVCGSGGGGARTGADRADDAPADGGLAPAGDRRETTGDMRPQSVSAGVEPCPGGGESAKGVMESCPGAGESANVRAEWCPGDMESTPDGVESVPGAMNSVPDAVNSVPRVAAELFARAVLGLQGLGMTDPEGEAAREVELIDEAHRRLVRERAEGDPLAVRVLAAAARVRVHTGWSRRARRGEVVTEEMSARALRLARACGDAHTIGASLLARHDAVWRPGTAAERLALAEEIHTVADCVGDEDLRIQGYVLRIAALLELGDPRAHSEQAALTAYADRTRLPRPRFIARSRAGALATVTGSPAAAAAIDDAYALGERSGEVDRLPLWLEQRWALALTAADEPAIARLTARYRQLPSAYAVAPRLLAAARRLAATGSGADSASPAAATAFEADSASFRAGAVSEVDTASPSDVPTFGADGMSPGVAAAFEADSACLGAGAASGTGTTTFGIAAVSGGDIPSLGTAVAFGADTTAPGSAAAFGADATSPGAGDPWWGQDEAGLVDAVRRGVDEVRVLLETYPRHFHAGALIALAEAAVALGDAELRKSVLEWMSPLRELWAVTAGGGAVYGPYAYWLGRLDAAGDRDRAAVELEAAAAAARRMRSVPWREAAERELRRLGTAPTRAAVLRAHTAIEPATNVFRLADGVWTLRFAGKTAHLPDIKGLRDLHTLIANPGHDISSMELLTGTGTAAATASAARRLGADTVLDERAKAEFRRRLERLDDEIDRATARSDDDRAAELDTERAALLDELRRAAGLGGRTRRLGDDAERARKTVSARIRDALRRLDHAHPELAEHLRACVSLGLVCRYQPQREIRWGTDRPLGTDRPPGTD